MTIEYNAERTIIKLKVETGCLGFNIVRLLFNDRSIDSVDGIYMINLYYDRAGSISDLDVWRGYDLIDYDSAQVVSLFSKFGTAYVPDLLRFFGDRVSCDSALNL